jgi:ATP-dependent exoDNAse (exonuclease V) alpha subunit
MTYNKSQSQTFHQVLLDATGEPFSHGHLYVAMSRIRLSWNLRVFISKRQLFPNPDDQ